MIKHLVYIYTALVAAAIIDAVSALQLSPKHNTPSPRRTAIKSIFGTAVSSSAIIVLPPINPSAFADDATVDTTDTTITTPSYKYEDRDRNKNKDALIREDYWYFSGKKPPRRLNIDAFPADDPTWNAWGECTKSEATGNSCVYVSLKQRIPAYGKYAFSINLGATEYTQLGQILRSPNPNWNAASKLVDPGYETRMPAPTVDALLKMALFATQMLTSANYSGPARELLVCRYYINECAFATRELAKAIDERDRDAALGLWEFGKDNWNSYLSIINRSISPKVGDKFEMIA